MSDQPIATRPVSENEKLLRQKYHESIAAQSDLIDKLSGQLLTLELAIPGAYAAVLKLISGDNAVVKANAAFYIAFVVWFVALILTLVALTPKKWKVDTTILKQDPAKFSEGLGIEDFFTQSAVFKQRLVIASSVLFFIGVFSATFTI